MAVISFEKYKVISDNLGEARASMLLAIGNMFAAVYEIAVLDDVQSTLDLLQPMFSAYQLADNSLRSINNFTAAVTALNNHVVRRGNFGTINEFLDSNDAEQEANKLDTQFVAMSNILGYNINSSYSQ